MVDQDQKDIDSTEFYDNAIKAAEEINVKDDDTESKEKDISNGEQEDREEEEQEDGSQQKKQDNILGKTPEEIDEFINQRTQEAIQKHDNKMREYHEAQANETVALTKMQQIEQVYYQYQQALKNLDLMIDNGEITPQQYKESYSQALREMQQLEVNYTQLQQSNKQASIPKIKRNNDIHYQKLQSEMTELKDPIVKKYANNLKEKVYDAGGVEIAQGGFDKYVKDFIASVVTEAEARGYQKAKNEFQKNSAKAKVKSVVQEGDSVEIKAGIRTADDIMNASKDDWLNYVLN